MAVERLVFHIGTAKTGTTATQSWLAENTRALVAHGVHYLQAYRKGPSHNFLLKSLNTHTNHAEIAQKLALELTATDARIAVLSSEVAYLAPRIASALGVLPARLLPATRLFFHFRRQDLYLESLIKQIGKIDPVRSHRGFLRRYGLQIAEAGRYLDNIRAIQRQFPMIAIECVPYHPMVLAQNNSAADFWQRLGLPAATMPELPARNANPSPSMALIEAMARYQFRTPFIRRQVTRILSRHHPALFQGRDIFNSAERQALLGRLRDHNAALAEYCGFDLVELFHNSVDFDAEAAGYLSDAEYRRAVDHAYGAIEAAVAQVN